MKQYTIEETLKHAREGTAASWNDAVYRGRTLLDEAAQRTDPAAAAALLGRAALHFQAAVAIDPARDEGYGWLARAFRFLAQATRGRSEETATFYFRCACAIAWEGKHRAPRRSPCALTREEAKMLLAWVHTNRRLDSKRAEVEMNALRVEFLTSALDPDTIADTHGG
ncbi:MAG TPA: hypothetical protein VFT32_05185 [Candidatus Eisenbacteria bacterium]|nr:hypothetical protein [Candidatus Eisenbacteria bacterium]